MSAGAIFFWEAFGTAMLILLGTGVVANHLLQRTNGNGGGPLFINIGWGFAVFVGASVADKSHAHINPAVTLASAITGSTKWGDVPIYFAGQMVGAFIGAVLCWLTYKLQFDKHDAPGETLGVFSTIPQIRNTVWNLVTEIIGTFVLVAWILFNPAGNTPLSYAGVAFVVLVIGTSLGGPTGYAINPARDLGPRIAYAVLPIRGKGSAQWGYSWIPVVGPLVGSTLAALLYKVAV